MANDNDNRYFDEDEYETGPPDDGGDYVEIYSKTAIFWFTLFFSTIFGGIMLAINLKNAGFKKNILPVLLFSIGYYLLAAIAASTLLSGLGLSAEQTVYLSAASSLITNLIGGIILTSYHFTKNFPEDDYYPRSLQGPLIAALILFVFQAMLARYVGIGI